MSFYLDEVVDGNDGNVYMGARYILRSTISYYVRNNYSHPKQCNESNDYHMHTI